MKSILEKSRYLALFGVIALLAASLAAYGWGILKTVSAFELMITTLGKSPLMSIEFIEVIDSFLIATTMLIFALSLYELFIGELNLPEWMLAHNLYELKTKLSSMIILVLAIKFLQKTLEVKDFQQLMYAAFAISAVSFALIAFGYFSKKD